MTSYHGWTHRKKRDGGTDPIYPDSEGDFAWARRYSWDESDQSITSGTQSNVVLADFFTTDASIFEAWDSGTEDGIKVLVSGLYIISYRLFWDDWPNAHQISFNEIDPDAWGSYSFNHSDGGFNNTFSSVGSFHARLAANQKTYMTVSHLFGSARALEGFGGNHFEMVRLGAVDTSEPRSGTSP